METNLFCKDLIGNCVCQYITPPLAFVLFSIGQPLDFTTNNEVDSQPPIYLLTSGTILANVSWAVGNDGMAMAPPLLAGKSATNMRYVFILPLVFSNEFINNS